MKLPTGPGEAGDGLRGGRLRRLPRALLGWTALGWAGWCLAGALLIVVPAPGEVLSFADVLLAELSLVVTVAGGVGPGVAALAGRAGWHGIARVTAAVCAGALVVSLIPLRDRLRTAAEQGVTVSPARYLPRPGAGAPSHTVTYVDADRSPGGSWDARRLDAWRPAGAGAQGRGAPAVVDHRRRPGNLRGHGPPARRSAAPGHEQ